MRLHFEDGERELFVARLGLDENSDDTAVAQAVAAWLAENPGNGDGNNGNNDDDVSDINPDDQDGVYVDASEYVRLKRTEREAGRIAAAERIRDRDELIEEAIADGKFSPARRTHYQARYDSDPDGTRNLIARLRRNTVPLEERGQDAPEDEADASAYPGEWLSESERATASAANQSGRPARRNRVHSE